MRFRLIDFQDSGATDRARGKNLNRRAACVIIGGGPAGAACGIALKRHDSNNERKVILIEKEPFPRFKVCGCCFNGAGASVLRSIGCEEIFQSTAAVPLHKWQAHFSGRVVRAKLPTGWAVSRNAFDSSLLDIARQAGVEVVQPATAKIIGSGVDGVELEITSNNATVEKIRADMVVVATGLAGAALEKWLPWEQSPSGPIGAGAAFATSCTDYLPGTIYMACGKGGYAGIVVLENGFLDVAAALYDPSGVSRLMPIGERITQILNEANMPVPPELRPENTAATEIQWKGTPLLHRQRQVASGRILAIGDAAGYVEPFTGEGMAWALRTAKIAADCIAGDGWSNSKNGNAYTTPQTSTEILAATSPGESYRKQYHRILSKRRLPCRIVAKSLRHNIGRKVLFTSLGHFPWLAKPFIRTINAE